MLGGTALLRDSILKDKASDFLHYCFFSKIKYTAREEEVDPCNITHAIDTIVKNGILFNRIQKEKKWAGVGNGGSYFYYLYFFLD